MRRLTVAGIAIVIVLIAAGLFLSLTGRRQQESDIRNVVVAQVGDFFLYMPLYYAEGKGFFEREGIRIHTVNTGGDEKSVAAVLSGDAVFGVGDPTFAAIAGQRGQDVRVIAGVVSGVPFWGVTRNPSVPEIREPTQLNGFSVATPARGG